MSAAPRPRSRTPNYGDATRVARLILGLLERPHGWSFAAVVGELGISERTLARYLASCREELVDREGRPLIETFRRGTQRMLRLANHNSLPDSTTYQLLSFYFALSVFQFLDGTVIREGVADLWERFTRAMPSDVRGRIAHFQHKFYVVPQGMKRYRKHDAQLDAIIFAITKNRRLRIEYTGVAGTKKVHEFEPYTLVLYRGGLYLLGRSHRGRKVVTLAVERIDRAHILSETFRYPADYSPEKHTEGIFGLIGGPETEVELWIKNPETRTYLESRQIHPTQRVYTRPDRRTVLTMTVRGTDELKYWILGFGPHLEVLGPAKLRAEVGGLLAEAARPYDRRGPRAAGRPVRVPSARRRDMLSGKW